MKKVKTIEDVETWVHNLGFSTEGPEGSYMHPIAPVSVLVETIDAHTDDTDALAALRRGGYAHGIPDNAAETLIEYARLAIEAARLLEERIIEAIRAHEAGDYEAAGAAFDDASGIESEWGDDPWTAAEALERGYSRDLPGRIGSWAQPAHSGEENS